MTTWPARDAQLAVANAAGQRTGVVDACLAANAGVHGLTIVTSNTRHFETVGVPYRLSVVDASP